MRRGEIWWAELPEPIGRRPVVLVSRDEAYEVRRSVAVVEVTTIIRGMATEVRLGRSEGMERRCVANADALHTIAIHRLSARAGRLSADRIQKLDDALRFALALDPRS
jgi:mRNA interferase MazF